MPVTFNIRHIEAKDLRLTGELPARELDIEIDEVIHPGEPLKYDLTAQKLDDAILVQGDLHLPIDCECVRCLKPFRAEIDLENWTCHLPLSGEERVVITNDCVDLTPYLREDILLELPSHPLCKVDCGGLPKNSIGKTNRTESLAQPEERWAELNKLKL